MNPRSLTILLVLPAVLVACAYGYQARGNLSDVAGELNGKSYPGNGGGGRFDLADRGGRLICDGEAWLTSQSPNPRSCAGESGEGLLRCTDGRQIPLRWEAIGCRSFQGSGVDGRGNRLIFRVNRSP